MYCAKVLIVQNTFRHFVEACACLQLASKKGGLGAQKVSNKSFSELEKKAQAVDKLREREEADAAVKKNIQSEESMCVLVLLLFPFVIFVA